VDGQHEEEEDTGEGGRCVHVNDRPANAASGFATNRTSTTKYTWWNFPFKNLYEQFRRVANSYFLLVMTIQLIPGVAPITPLTSILPLLFVLSVTAVKDAWDDWNRRKADNEVNNRTASISQRDLVSGSVTWRDVAYKDIAVGDQIKIYEGEEFPADIVFIKSAAHDHQCFIETSDLDGETTKKIKRALVFTSTMTEAELAGIEATVECDAPNIHLDAFNGKFTLRASSSSSGSSNPTHQYALASKLTGDVTFPLNETQLLPRGARLVNTPFIIGVVVYTGTDTKLVLNQQPVPLKFSYVERITNKLLIALVAFILCLCLITAVLSVYWRADVGSRIPYLMMPNDVRDDFESRRRGPPSGRRPVRGHPHQPGGG
jgi:phospholipid-transporting ATPase